MILNDNIVDIPLDTVHSFLLQDNAILIHLESLKQ